MCWGSLSRSCVPAGRRCAHVTFQSCAKQLCQRALAVLALLVTAASRGQAATCQLSRSATTLAVAQRSVCRRCIATLPQPERPGCTRLCHARKFFWLAAKAPTWLSWMSLTVSCDTQWQRGRVGACAGGGQRKATRPGPRPPALPPCMWPALSSPHLHAVPWPNCRCTSSSVGVSTPDLAVSVMRDSRLSMTAEKPVARSSCHSWGLWS